MSTFVKDVVERQPSPEPAPGKPAGDRISAAAYLRTLGVLLWECLAHPFSTSTIDAHTGKLVSRR